MSVWIAGAFLILLLLHTLRAIVKYAAKTDKPAGDARSNATLNIVLQTVIAILAAALAYRWGAISRDLLSPIAIATGLFAGHLIFGVSLLVTHRSMEDARGHFLDFGSVWEFVVEHPYVLSRFIFVGISEELVWRAAAQPALTGVFAWGLGEGIDARWAAIGAVVIASVAFSLVHEHFLRDGLLVTIEFLGFALLLGFLYYWTGSLILVIIIHAVRDIEIAYLEFAINANELGDEEKASEEVERIYRPSFRRSHE